MVRSRTRLCRACNSQKGKAWSKANRQRAREVAKARRHTKPEEMRAAKASYYERNKEKWREYHANFRRKCMTDPVRRAQLMLTFTRTRAARKGVPFEIDLDFLAPRLQAGRCEATGLRLVLDEPWRCKTRKHPHSPSIDRIDPERGYTPDNTRVVAYLYNVAKSDYSDADVLELARAIVAANGENSSPA